MAKRPLPPLEQVAPASSAARKSRLVAARAGDLEPSFDAIFIDEEECGEVCPPLYRYLAGESPGSMEVLLRWCLDNGQMKLFAAASRQYPGIAVIVDIERVPEVAARLRESGALHGVVVGAGADIDALAPQLLHPTVVQLDVDALGRLHDMPFRDALCRFLRTTESLGCVGISCLGVLPDEVLQAVADSPSPITEVILDAASLQLERQGADANPGLSALLQKKSLAVFNVLQDSNAIIGPLANCILSMPAPPAIEFVAKGKFGIYLAEVLMEKPHRAAVRFVLVTSPRKAAAAARELADACWRNPGLLESILIENDPEDESGTEEESEADDLIDEANERLELVLEQRLQREFRAARLGPDTMVAGLQSFAIELSKGQTPSIASSDVIGLVDALGRSEVSWEPSQAAALASLTKEAASRTTVSSRRAVTRLKDDLVRSGYERQRVEKAVDKTLDPHVSLRVSPANVAALAETLAAPRKVDRLDLEFLELSSGMATQVEEALDGCRNLREAHIALPANPSPFALGVLLRALGNHGPARVSLGGLVLERAQRIADSDTGSLEAIKRFVASHPQVAASLVSLFAGMHITFEASQADRLREWASKECFGAVEALEELLVL